MAQVVNLRQRGEKIILISISKITKKKKIIFFFGIFYIVNLPQNYYITNIQQTKIQIIVSLSILFFGNNYLKS